MGMTIRYIKQNSRKDTCKNCPELDVNYNSDESYCNLADGDEVRLKRGQHRPEWCPMKEQETVKPKQIIRKQCKKEHSDGSIDYFAEWYCPHCNSLILRGFNNPSIKFCYKCGKPILWEGR